jgi:hypothetical protein
MGDQRGEDVITGGHVADFTMVFAATGREKGQTVASPVPR